MPPPAPVAPAGVRAAIGSTLLVRGDAGPHLVLPEAIADRALAAMTQHSKPYPPASASDKYGVCALSGLPAKYKDPLTGQRYGNLEAFRTIRAGAE